MLKKDGKTVGSFQLGDAPAVIGRSEECDLVIPDPSVSRRHAEVAFVDGVWRIRDLGSRNGTRIGTRPVTDDVVKPGESFFVGDVELVLVVAEEKSGGTVVKPVVAGAAAPASPAGGTRVVGAPGGGEAESGGTRVMGAGGGTVVFEGAVAEAAAPAAPAAKNPFVGLGVAGVALVCVLAVLLSKMSYRPEVIEDEGTDILVGSSVKLEVERSPEELLELARSRIKDWRLVVTNLWEAKQYLQQALDKLAVGGDPELRAEVEAELARVEQLMDAEYRDRRLRAERAIRLGQIREARAELEYIIAFIRDKNAEGYRYAVERLRSLY